MRVVKTYRGIDEKLIKDVQHLAIDTGRNEGDLVNEALMILLEIYEKIRQEE